jgi:hypothetical protein
MSSDCGIKEELAGASQATSVGVFTAKYVLLLHTLLAFYSAAWCQVIDFTFECWGSVQCRSGVRHPSCNLYAWLLHSTTAL